MKPNPTPSTSALVYSTECVNSTTARILNEHGKVIATISRPITLAKVRQAIAGASK